MKEQTRENVKQEKLKSLKFRLWFALGFCIFLSVAEIAGIVCLLVFTDDKYAPVVLAVALAFGWFFEGVAIITPAYRQIKQIKAEIAASENI